ncbi:hypothetical protein DdX_06324 [Ditylenchus destructor]|uniref:Uncharacterized protein n=1 Tax=Ditylenchus destructor TaxID=166010 RepID=A0AAD4N7F7_9BILA|nr:hypothetical protein DdX_06324 [Ditylenchus destructor]
MDNRLTKLFELYIQTDNDEGLLEALAEAVSDVCSKDIESALRRNAPRRRNSSAAERLTHNYYFPQKVISAMADDIVSGQTFQKFRSHIVNNCICLVEKLWLLDKSSKMAEIYGYNTHEPSLNRFNEFTMTRTDFDTPRVGRIVFEENEFTPISSAEPSARTVPEELGSIVELIISNEIPINARLENTQKLLNLSPSVLAKPCRAFDTLLGHFHSILKESKLFPNAMNLLAKFLASHDETVWTKIAISVARIAPGLCEGKRQISADAKFQFVDFLVQMFDIGPRVWRTFSNTATCSILISFMDLIGTELHTLGPTGSYGKFCSILAALDSSVRWLRKWLRNYNFRRIVDVRIAEIMNEILDTYNRTEIEPTETSHIFTFHSSIVLTCIMHSDLLRRLQWDSLRNFLIRLLEILSHCENRKRTDTMHEILQNLMPLFGDILKCHASANFLIHHLIPDIVRLIPAQYCLNLLTNIFRYSTNLPSTNSPAIKCISVLLNSCVKSGTSNCNGANISINAAQNKGSNSVENCSMNDSAMILLDLLLDRYPISEFFALGLDLHTIAASKDLARPLALVDPIKCRIILASGFLTSSIRDARAARLWRQSHRYIAETCLCQNLCGLAIPHAFELITSNDKRLARKVLMDFLNQRSPTLEKHCQNWDGHLIVDELSAEILPILNFLVIGNTHSRDLRRWPPTRHQLIHKITNFPQSMYESSHHGESLSKSYKFLKLTNKKDTNLNGLSNQTKNGPRSHFDWDSDSYTSVLSSSDYELKNEDIFREDNNFFDNETTTSSAKSSTIGSRSSSISDDSWEEDPPNAELERNWLRLMSLSGARRQSLWTGNSVQQKFVTQLFIANNAYSGHVIRMLSEYLDSLQGDSIQKTPSNTVKLGGRMNSFHAHWLGPLLDYAVYDLQNISDRRLAKKKCAELRFISNPNNIPKKHGTVEVVPDWFIGVIFVATGLDAKVTNAICDRILNLMIERNQVPTFWPAAALQNPGSSSSPRLVFSDAISTQVFPLVLRILWQPIWSRLFLWTLDLKLPLLHLLLFYSNQLYLGVLNFDQIQEYLALSVVVGASFQAAHFVSLLFHILRGTKKHGNVNLVHQNLVLQQFLRPSEALAKIIRGFRFSDYAYLFEEEKYGFGQAIETIKLA